MLEGETQQRCDSTNARGGRCIALLGHFGMHQDSNGAKWFGDAAPDKPHRGPKSDPQPSH